MPIEWRFASSAAATSENVAGNEKQLHDKNRRTHGLEIFGHEPHPEFFARADHENGEQQNNEIAFKSKKIGQGFEGEHTEVLAESRGLFKHAAKIVPTTV